LRGSRTLLAGTTTEFLSLVSVEAPKRKLRRRGPKRKSVRSIKMLRQDNPLTCSGFRRRPEVTMTRQRSRSWQRKRKRGKTEMTWSTKLKTRWQGNLSSRRQLLRRPELTTRKFKKSWRTTTKSRLKAKKLSSSRSKRSFKALPLAETT